MGQELAQVRHPLSPCSCTFGVAWGTCHIDPGSSAGLILQMQCNPGSHRPSSVWRNVEEYYLRLGLSTKG